MSDQQSTGGSRPLEVPIGAVVRIQKIGGDYYAEPEAVPRDDVVTLAAPIVAIELRALADEIDAGIGDVLRRRARELDESVFG